MERDRLVLFINKLILHRRNVKDIMDAAGVRILVDLLTLAHLHTSRYSGFQVMVLYSYACMNYITVLFSSFLLMYIATYLLLLT